MPLVIQVLALTLNLIPFLPHPIDKHGWGLRVHRLTQQGPYLFGEDINHDYFELMLLNFSKETRKYTPLAALARPRELSLRIIQPDKTGLRAFGRGGVKRNPFAVPAELPPGEFTSVEFQFRQFRFSEVSQLGKHRIIASLEIDGKTITSPPVEFEVVDVPADAVLASHTVPLEGIVASRRPEEQERPVVQQVRIAKRTLLIYRVYHGPKWGGIGGTFRLAELPGKVEMKVEGAYGAGKPLTVTYKDPKSPTETTKLVINSIDGMPWTEEEERLLREREEKEKARIAPPPWEVSKPKQP